MLSNERKTGLKYRFSKEGGANRIVSMVTGCLPCRSGATGRSLAGPSATLRLQGANQEREDKKEDQSEGRMETESRPQVSWEEVRTGNKEATENHISLSLVSF